MSSTKYDFDSWRAKLVLEALQTLEEKWTGIIQSTDDEDVQADYGNDIAQLQILREGFERFAIAEFGPGVKNFSREPLTATPKA